MRDAIVSHLPISTSRKEIKDGFAQNSEKTFGEIYTRPSRAFARADNASLCVNPLCKNAYSDGQETMIVRSPDNVSRSSVVAIGTRLPFNATRFCH
jgi:hypothetical protein